MIDTVSTSISIEQIREESNRIKALLAQVSTVIVGQKEALELALIALICNGHILLEGVPGVAKTTMIKTIAAALGVGFNRIQFTPDLLPADILGTMIFNPDTRKFDVRLGPIFANLILADEINRSPAKVQSALLEAMQERQVTIGGQTYKLEDPFLVFATQNPLEQEGTYRLPEAQVDRFLFKVLITYPTEQQEREILLRSKAPQQVSAIMTQQEIRQLQQLVHTVYVDEKIIEYIIAIIFATRTPQKKKLNDIAPYLMYGVSPRATLALFHAVRACALLDGLNFVTPDHVRKIGPAVLRHRLIISPDAETDGVTEEIIIQRIFNTIPTP